MSGEPAAAVANQRRVAVGARGADTSSTASPFVVAAFVVLSFVVAAAVVSRLLF